MSNPSGQGMTPARLGRNITMRRLSRASAGIITGGLLFAVAACGGDDPKVSPEPTPSDPTSSNTQTTEATPTDPTPTEPASDEDAAAAALLGYLEVRDEAYATGRISNKLNKYATGREHFALQQLVTQLTTPPETRFEGAWSHEITAANAQQDGAILVTDCEDGSEVEIVRQSDGETLSWISFEGKELPRRIEQTYRVAEDDGRWKVSSAESLPNKVTQC